MDLPYFSFSTMDPMLVMIKDIPPNPEDGEFFLPSDIVKEINLGTIKLKHRLCYASVLTSCTPAKVQLIDSDREASAHVLPNNQGYEKETEQVSLVQQNYTWADLLKGETRNLHNNIEGRHSMVQSIEPQKIGAEVIPLNKQPIHPNVASKMNGNK